MSTYAHINVDEISEERRLAYRPEIQRKLAEIEIKRHRLNELQTVIRSIESDSEAAANDHTSTCEPLQAELREIDDAHIAAILARKPVPPETTRRRIEILRSISEANTVLEMRVAANKKSAAKLRGEWNATRMETVDAPALENSLISLASVALRDRHAILHSRGEWAGHRLKSAQNLVAVNAERIALEKSHRNPSLENQAIYTKRLRQHELLVTDAAAEVTRLDTELAAMRALMRDE